MALSYFEIWTGIDRLAESLGLSPSGLAVRAGLDPTAFNKSKRAGPDGRKRWLSMESLNKVLEATHTSFVDFLALAGEELPSENAPTIPLLEEKNLAKTEFIGNDGEPINAHRWDTLLFPADRLDEEIYALEISSHAAEPVYRKGDRLIVSTTAEIRAGDRVVVKTTDEEIVIGELARCTHKSVDIEPFGKAKKRRILASDILWVVRILWASQ